MATPPHIIPAAIADYINEAWQKLNPATRPWGIWISSHHGTAPDAFTIETPAYAVWFLDASGLQSRSIWDYERFIAIHFDKPWNQVIGEPPGIFGKRWELGLARFAKLQESEDYLIEIMLGSLLGESNRVAINPDNTLQFIQKLWIS